MFHFSLIVTLEIRHGLDFIFEGSDDVHVEAFVLSPNEGEGVVLGCGPGVFDEFMTSRLIERMSWSSLTYKRSEFFFGELSELLVEFSLER